MKTRLVSILIGTLLVIAACPKNEKSQNKDPKVESWGSKTGQAPVAAQADETAAISGEVLETIDVPNYTYVKLKTADGETWAAVNTAKLEKGQKISIANANLMQSFRSETLGRTFDRIWFGVLASGAGNESSADPHAGMNAGGGMMPHPGGMNPAADIGEIKVPKAEGANAYTVSEVHQKIADLNEKPVAVRAKVVNSTRVSWGKTGSMCATAAAAPTTVLSTLP